MLHCIAPVLQVRPGPLVALRLGARLSSSWMSPNRLYPIHTTLKGQIPERANGKNLAILAGLSE